LTERNSLKHKDENTLEKNDILTKQDLETKQSTQPEIISATNPTNKDGKSDAYAIDLSSKGRLDSSIGFPIVKAAEKNKDKSKFIITNNNKSVKNITPKAIVDTAILSEVLNSKIKTTANDNPKSNNRVISADSSLNKSNISINNKVSRPYLIKGISDEAGKSKDNKLPKTNFTNKNNLKVSSLNKNVISSGSVIVKKNESKPEIHKVNNDLIKTSRKSSVKSLTQAEQKLKKEQGVKPEEKQIENNLNQIKPENVDSNSIKNAIKEELALDTIILNKNKTCRNSFEDLSDLKNTFSDKKLNTMENSNDRNFESQEINTELKKEDLDKIKLLEEKRKKLYSKLGYDVIESRDSLSKSNNFMLNQRKSDLDVFQNVNIKKLAKIMERRFSGLRIEDDFDDEIKADREEKASVAEETDTSDFINLNTKKIKRKATHKRFSLI